MKKKFMTLLLASMAASLALTGCSSADNGTSTGSAPTSDLKVGMVTDAGTIDDKSFNQGTWEGIVLAGEELGVDTLYLKPAGTTEADYLKEIANHYDTGRRLVITPGYKFETAIFHAQEKYPDAKFVLIDGAPHAGDYAPVVGDNTVSIFYAEHESGFLAGVAAAVELQEANMGFIGGMEIPAVQKFNWGFQQGVAYANENLGTNVAMAPENILYQGTFDDAAAGTQIAATMYDKGVDAIFAAAGGVGSGVIKEAQERALSGEEVWVVGVDVDQYADGLYDSNGDGKVTDEDESIVITSAVKYLGTSAYEMIEAELNGTFPGGQTLTLDVTNKGVGIPLTNPNLSDETMATVAEVEAKIASGEVTVVDNNDEGNYVK